MQVWVRYGAMAGAAFAIVGIGFVGLSLFTDVPRSTWLTLNQLKGAVGFGLCALAGGLVGRRARPLREAGAAGALAGLVAGISVPLAIYLLSFGFLDAVRQYPFEYHDILSSDAPSARAFLESPGGRATATATSLGLLPVIAIWAAVQGGLLGAGAGWLGRRWPRGSSAREASA